MDGWGFLVGYFLWGWWCYVMQYLFVKKQQNKRVFINIYPIIPKTQQVPEMQQQQIQTQPPQRDRFSIFLNSKNAQNSYGVKTGDYMRYRRYCTRKITKLRKIMDYKYGNRTKFIKKDITVDRAQDKKIIQICLLSCQKYWAFANEVKFNESIKQKKSNKLRAKFTAVKKFNRAYQWSCKLVKLCQRKSDHVTINQAEAYSFYLEGLLYLEKQEWKTCQTKLIACRQIISDLLQNIDTMNSKVYHEKIDQIDQTIKFCNFKLSKGKELSIQQIIQMRKNGQQSLSTLLESLSQRRLKELSISQTNELKFGNQRYPVKDMKIVQIKNNVDLVLENLGIIGNKVLGRIEDEQLFQQLLNLFSTAINTIDSAIKYIDSSKQNVKIYNQGEIAILKKIGILFQEIKFKVLINRNDIIFKYSYANGDRDSKRGAPQNLAKLLSNTMSIYAQTIDLQKAKNQGSDGVQPQKLRSIDSKIFYYRSLRLFFVGQVYYNNQKTKQAYSLWQECQRCIQSIKNSQQPTLLSQLNLVPLEDISATLKQNKLKCIIKNYKNNQIGKQKLNNQMEELTLQEKMGNEEDTLYELMVGSGKNKVMGLGEYVDLKPIQLPGQMQPLPTRPIFFDIFESMIKYPTLENKIQKGWFGKLFNR